MSCQLGIATVRVLRDDFPYSLHDKRQWICLSSHFLALFEPVLFFPYHLPLVMLCIQTHHYQAFSAFLSPDLQAYLEQGTHVFGLTSYTMCHVTMALLAVIHSPLSLISLIALYSHLKTDRSNPLKISLAGHEVDSLHKRPLLLGSEIYKVGFMLLCSDALVVTPQNLFFLGGGYFSLPSTDHSLLFSLGYLLHAHLSAYLSVFMSSLDLFPYSSVTIWLLHRHAEDH